ncbi:SURF1 family protein [Thalassotalea euphylliae]|uniref:SURF1 family protein n=1 Tax=Thalassotalea euphylliae TaxID=1655234 RepID=UPI0036DC9E39
MLRQTIGAVSWPWLLFTLLVFAVLIKLGLWQLGRAEEKEVRLEKMSEFSGQQHVRLENLLSKKLMSVEQNDWPVSISGSFVPDVLFLLDNQMDNGQYGNRVFQILESNEYRVLVNLGWVPASRDRKTLPDVEPIQGFHQLKGNIRVIEKGIVLAQQEYSTLTMPYRIQQVEPEKLSTLIGKPLLPFAIYLDKNEAIGYKKYWQPIVMPPEKHRGYAFQWFSLATAWMCLMVWAAYKHNKKKAE